MKSLIVKIGKMLYDKDLTSGTSGNISILSGERMYITGTGTALGLLTEKDIVETDLDGKETDHEKRASSEKHLHLAIYKLRKDLKAIIHCHSPFLTSFAACRKELSDPIISENILYFGKIPLAEYAMPSSKELVENTSKMFKDYETVLMANHGVIAAADTLINAFFKIETAETYAKSCLYTKLIGSPVFLNQNEICDLEFLKAKIHNKK